MLLVIFDDSLNIKYLVEQIGHQSELVHLFPLTGNELIIRELQSALAQLQIQYQLILSADKINDQVIAMQENINQWSQQLGEFVVKQRNLKEWFMLPDGQGSAWWFGVISEKNSVQNTAFFRLAQFNAIQKYIKDASPHTVFMALRDKQARQMIKNCCPQISAIELAIKKNKQRLKQRLMQKLERPNLFTAILAAGMHLLLWFKQAHIIRKQLPPIKQRIVKKNPFMFISYFPNIDNQLAENGIFKNKYAALLQEKLKGMQVPITWLLMPVYYNGHDYYSAATLAKKFAEHGERLTVLQEFFTFNIFLQSVYWWARQAFTSVRLLKKIPPKALTQILTSEAGLPIIKELWHHSFVGSASIRGIIFYLTYSQAFKAIPNIKQCLYYCEMQAWEKALIMAKNAVQPKAHAMAFQHTVVPRNFFHYFYHPKDTKQNQIVTDFPVPELLIANGNQPFKFLAQSEFPNLKQAEAIRQLYINNQKHIRSGTARSILFVAGSYDRQETQSLLSLLYCAFPQADDFEIWIKASPINPVQPLFDALNVNLANTKYKICNEDVSKILPQVNVALVANTTVAIEAAAASLPVIIPILADTMLMNPILDTDATFYTIRNAHELRTQVIKLMKTCPENLNGNFINQYWNLDPNLTLWNKILDASSINA